MVMKKLLLLTIISLLFSLYAITPSVIFGAQKYNINGIIQGQFYVDITLTHPIGNLSLYGNYRNEMDFSTWEPFRFKPKQDFYTVGASYDFDFATIRLEHMCMHPVVSQSRWSGLQGGYTRFEVQI
jgi:hypothetical protein